MQRTKTLKLVLGLAGLAPALAAHANETAETESCATVEVHGVRPQQGFLMVAAYADAASFGSKPIAQKRLPAGDATMSFAFCGLGAGPVALTMYQDLDGDGQMGRNLLGMPTEPWGATGHPGSFGPAWETTQVALDGKPLLVQLSQ
jgi:uncharacterized protein (DUF2141 family)